MTANRSIREQRRDTVESRVEARTGDSRLADVLDIAASPAEVDMPKNNMTFKIEGEAGQGVESGGGGFAKAMARGGLHVFGIQDYMSRIRGGHNFYQVRVSERPLYSHTDEVDLLMALLPGSIERHTGNILAGGGIIGAGPRTITRLWRLNSSNLVHKDGGQTHRGSCRGTEIIKERTEKSVSRQDPTRGLEEGEARSGYRMP